MNPVKWSEIEYFTADEFKCKHCDVEKMDHTFVSVLDYIRTELGAPIKITSGYRCPVHNQAVSTTGPTGPHTTGMASDLSVAPERFRALLTLTVAEFPGIGVNLKGTGRFIHVDDLEPRAWSY